jgi:hypothetical protein
MAAKSAAAWAADLATISACARIGLSHNYLPQYRPSVIQSLGRYLCPLRNRSSPHLRLPQEHHYPDRQTNDHHLLSLRSSRHQFHLLEYHLHFLQIFDCCLHRLNGILFSIGEYGINTDITKNYVISSFRAYEIIRWAANYVVFTFSTSNSGTKEG